MSNQTGISSNQQVDLFGDVQQRALLDKLFEDSKLYTNSKDFKELLDFVIRLRNFAPFNALLLQGKPPANGVFRGLAARTILHIVKHGRYACLIARNFSERSTPGYSGSGNKHRKFRWIVFAASTVFRFGRIIIGRSGSPIAGRH